MKKTDFNGRVKMHVRKISISKCSISGKSKANGVKINSQTFKGHLQNLNFIALHTHEKTHFIGKGRGKKGPESVDVLVRRR